MGIAEFLIEWGSMVAEVAVVVVTALVVVAITHKYLERKSVSAK